MSLNLSVPGAMGTWVPLAGVRGGSIWVLGTKRRSLVLSCKVASVWEYAEFIYMRCLNSQI